MWFLATTAFAPMPGAKLTCPSEGLRHLTLHGGSRILMDDLAPVTAYVTPNALAPPEVRTTWSNYMTSDGGMNITTTTGIREAHTRMALHMHEFGGQTCVLAGAPATVFVGGGPPEGTVYPAGTCYYMPPNVYMTSANLHDEDSLLMDILFQDPTGSPGTITICEKGWEKAVQCRNEQDRGCGEKWSEFVAQAAK